ncbi:MAG: CBS domain-containing protein [Chloroflexi bacterium]|nr:CBS domain-containing protein [Chloroflexota bacterium]
MKIQNILATTGTRVVTIHPDRSLKDAVGLLAQHNIGALVVVIGLDEVVGILSERDIVRAAVHNDNVLGLSVQQIMTKHVVTGSPNDDLKSVMNTMTEKQFRHLPIVEQGKLVGIVSIRDLVKAQVDQYQGEIETLETQIMEA